MPQCLSELHESWRLTHWAWVFVPVDMIDPSGRTPQPELNSERLLDDASWKAMPPPSAATPMPPEIQAAVRSHCVFELTGGFATGVMPRPICGPAGDTGGESLAVWGGGTAEASFLGNVDVCGGVGPPAAGAAVVAVSGPLFPAAIFDSISWMYR